MACSCPRGIPIFGNTFQVSDRPQESYTKWREEWGKIFYLKFYKYDVIVLNDVKLIKECFNENVFTGRSEAMFTAVLSMGKNGILLSEGQTWVEQRRFTLRHLRDFGFGKQYMEDLIMDEVKDMIDDLKKQEGQSVMMNEKFALAVINSLWMIVAGKKFKHDDEEKIQILYDIDRMFATLSITSIIFLMEPWLLKVLPGPLGFTKTLALRDRLHEMLHDEITEHEETLPKDGNPRDFIDAYLLQIKETTEEKSSFYKEEGYKQLIAGIGDLFFAGSDTTSTTLSWTMLFMAYNPEVQTKLQMELDSVVGKSRSVSLADKSKLPYAEATVLEILRSSSITVLGNIRPQTTRMWFVHPNRNWRELTRKFAIWSWNETLTEDRISSLQKGLDSLNKNIELLDKKLEEQSEEFLDIRDGMTGLEKKINSIAESNCHCKIMIEENHSPEHPHGKYMAVQTPIIEMAGKPVPNRS
ncbi:unnamed protein product [Allacma fusca]|uniref:Cytochrome P450 n=1 Tax=Allacma fusca TaxID=39272 RepID=A0A8J2LQ66_9HEXA|nr:unnamed protein product [Allacma fusca]